MILKSLFVLCTVLGFSASYRIGFENYFDSSSETTSGPQVKESRLYGEKKTYHLSEGKVDWYTARTECKKKGMVLACPLTYSEEQNMESYLRDYLLEPVDKFSGYWIGSHRASDTSPWIWEANNEEIRSNRYGWLPFEPSQFTGENCMQIKKDLGKMGWNNYYCENIGQFICESVPITHESKKNDVHDPKETLPEETNKGFLREEDNNENIIGSTTEDYYDDYENYADLEVNQNFYGA